MSTATNPQANQEVLRQKLAEEVYLPPFLHILETQYGVVPRDRADVESLMKQAQILREDYDNRRVQQAAASNPIMAAERKLASLLGGQPQQHGIPTSHEVEQFTQRLVADESMLKAAAEFYGLLPAGSASQPASPAAAPAPAAA